MENMKKELSADDLAYLARHVKDRCRRDGDCLIWTMRSTNHGKAVLNLRVFRNMCPRKILWRSAGKKVVPGWVFSAPDCDPMCIEPKHQIHQSRRDAARLAAKRGLFSSGARHSLAIRKGRKSGRLVYSDEQVAAMRARYAETGNCRQVAREFKVNPAYALRVVRNELRKVNTVFSI